MRDLLIWQRLKVAEAQVQELTLRHAELDAFFGEMVRTHATDVAQLKTAIAHIEARYDAFQALYVQAEMARCQCWYPQMKQRVKRWVDNLLGIPFTE